MAETEATIKDLKERLASTATNASQTNFLTNLTAVAAVEAPTPDVVAKYQSLCRILADKRVEEQQMRDRFTTNNLRLQNVITQRELAEADVQQFEDHNPGLAAVKTGAPGASPFGPTADPMAALEYAQTRQHSMAARYKVLTNQLSQLRDQAMRLDAAEDDIAKAETAKQVAEAKYKHYLFSLEQSRIDAGNKALPIITAEQPTPGSHESVKILKAAGGILGAFLALALGLPFFIEMVLDQSFKQPMDVKARIDAPFFLTIPKTNGRHSLPELERAKPAGLLSTNGATPHAADEEPDTLASRNGKSIAPWTERRELRPFFETLRDRLMTYFEMINLTHKPKLVAVTSCCEGAGVTTTAVGLASSLSEIGEGNVLLVNMSARDGEAHHFYKGKRDCRLEEVLATEKRNHAQVQDHLFLAKEMGSGDSLPRVLPKRFSHLVPLMKASDYDYIIFDMPPISEISITPRLARFMDMVLLVIESEKTSHAEGTRAAALLAESKTNVGLVLNKNRSYLPKRLQNI
jgi:Mrp family chromosome partitioning ATPase